MPKKHAENSNVPLPLINLSIFSTPQTLQVLRTSEYKFVFAFFPENNVFLFYNNLL